MTDRRKVDVPVEPLSEERWDRLERRLGAARDEDALTAPVPDLRRGTRRLALVTALAAGVAAGAGLMWWRAHGGAGQVAGPPPRTTVAAEPLHVATPVGGASHLELGDARLDVGDAAELDVERAADGTTTVRLARGEVTCDVEPRPGRAPFHVVADDVVVTVVGTRFAVARDGDVRVRVERGTVKVAGPRGEQKVTAGQGWTRAHDQVVTLAELDAPHPGSVGPQPNNMPQTNLPPPNNAPPPGAAPDAGTAAEDVTAATALEPTDPDAAADRYRALARGGGLPAEEAAFRLARLELSRDRWDATVAATAAYEARFPRGAHLEEILWFTVEANCGAYRSRAAEAAARAYLDRFPDGAHAAAARASGVCTTTR
jgi:hypothetical protein